MASLSTVLLSGSTDGKQIKVTGTGTGSTVIIHTANATAKDAIWLYADNDDTTQRTLTLEVGAATDPDNTLKITIPARGVAGSDGRINVLDGYILTNSLILKAYADSANKIKLSGFVVRDA